MKKFLTMGLSALILSMLCCAAASAQGSPNQPPHADLQVVIIIINGGSSGSDKKSVDAGPSYDLDGELVGFEWDLDGNGSFETDTGGLSRAEVGFTEPGDYWVGVRVTDDAGDTDTHYAWVTLN
ncbi:PKD domain-containing protein [bacterium]|nr:PKD domain-containing protein [bacterium]